MPPTITQPRVSPKHRDTDQNTELVPPSDPRSGLVSIDPDRQSGTPCFVGTRVPLKDLFDYLEGGETVASFLESFPTVSSDQARRAIRLAANNLIGHRNGEHYHEQTA